MLRAARLSAIDHVALEAPPESAAQVSWFYGAFLGLAALPALGDHRPAGLRFRSDRHEVRVTLNPEPRIDSVDVRIHFEVSSLEQAAETLEDHRYPFDWIRGLSFTDRGLMLLDPAGNRVVLRRWWPAVY